MVCRRLGLKGLPFEDVRSSKFTVRMSEAISGNVGRKIYHWATEQRRKQLTN